ncbi:MAG: hypothetical protein LUF30_03000 [Lachnospiraceae bacterium]|nr:hypothetical protein [Lachnospiraceae bacterium]
MAEKVKRFARFAARVVLFFALSCILSMAVPAVGGFDGVTALAATNYTSVRTPNSWLLKNQKVYYINSKGKRVFGLVEIGNHTYYFDEKGVQRTGWQKIDGYYYYFKIGNGKSGYMLTSTTVNGITIKKSGKADTSGVNETKLQIMVQANQIMQSVTKPTMTKAEKLKLCYEYLVENVQYRGSPTFKNTTYWAWDYAASVFSTKKADCYGYGAAFAFLANAVGYPNCYAVSSGGHGWAEVKGLVYDVSWELVDTSHSYYAVSYSLSGIDGRPNYKAARNYTMQI